MPFFGLNIMFFGIFTLLNCQKRDYDYYTRHSNFFKSSISLIYRQKMHPAIKRTDFAARSPFPSGVSAGFIRMVRSFEENDPFSGL